MTDDQFGFWLAGLVDGEGHLGVTRTPKVSRDRSKHVFGYNYRCIFRIVLAEPDEALLHMCQERTQLGRVYKYDRKTKSKAGTLHRPFVVWSVNSKPYLQGVKELLEKYPLQSKKAKEFTVWKEAVEAHLSRQKLGQGVSNEEANAVMERCYHELRRMRAE